MAVRRCPNCNRHIEWLTTRSSRLPFDHELVPVEELGERQGWLVARVTVRGTERAIAVPMEHCGTAKREAARRALVVHTC